MEREAPAALTTFRLGVAFGRGPRPRVENLIFRMPYAITLDDAPRLVTITFSGTVPYTELLDLKAVVWPQV
jgi:hypothetical protein